MPAQAHGPVADVDTPTDADVRAPIEADAPPYVDVAVEVPTTRLGDTFTYSVPSGLSLQPGQLVRVPFGPRSVHGVVVRLTSELRVDYVKPVAAVLESEPLITETQLALARWVSGYYMAPLFDAIAPMLPPGQRARTQSGVRLKTGVPEPEGLAPSAQRLLTYLRRHHRTQSVASLARMLGEWVPDAVRALARAGLIEEHAAAARPPPSRREVDAITLTSTSARDAEQLGARALKQAALARRLADPGGSPYLASRARSDFGAAAVAALLRKGIATIAPVPVETRDGPHPAPEPPLLPTPAQAEALAALREAMNDASSDPGAVQTRAGARAGARTFLLQGATGSGKTEVYLQALAHCLSLGKRGLVLVPELSLTPQTVAQFNARFPGQVGVLHSGLTAAQQAVEWWRSRHGERSVIVGSRGAVFAPVDDLGLIVLDEEHEWTYKQPDASPRYHAREVALKLAELTGAVVVLGSATPEVESAYRAERGVYRHLRLPHRIERSGAPAPLATIQVVDMRKELKEGNRGVFSRELRASLEECVGAGHQAMLFLNRRGAAAFVECRSCGFVLRCWRCSTPYTYHAARSRGAGGHAAPPGDAEGHAARSRRAEEPDADGLVCHHCNRRRRVPATCPQCRGRTIRYMGLGTQRLVDEVQSLLPGASVLRWDRDTASTAKAHADLLERFTGGEADVLVGTQMIAKGLHVPAVTLVGVVLADIGLHVPDFRAAERIFQVLMQVAGRAGRGPEPGRVIVQTYVPEHFAITTAADQDYAAFYGQELRNRRAHGAPPIGRLIRLQFAHANESTAKREAQRLGATLKRLAHQWGITGVDVVGPAPAYPPRLRGAWRWHLLLRGTDPRLLLDKVEMPPNWVVDVDPAAV